MLMSNHPGRAWAKKGSLAAVAAVLVQCLAIAGHLTSAASANSCADPTPYELLAPAGTMPTAPITPTDTLMLSELGQAKAAAGVNSQAALADMQIATAMSPSRAEKLQKTGSQSRATSPSPISIDQLCGSAGARGSLLGQVQGGMVTTALATDGTTHCVDHGQLCGWLNNINHQSQICTPHCLADPKHINYYCGPATVAEATTTEGVAVSQATAASYMGTSPPPTGTTVSGITKGMQNLVGVPVMGYIYYVWNSEPWNPPYNFTVFKGDIQFDTYDAGMPVAGDGVEVYGFYPNGQPYPHLLGHQITAADSPVYHIFLIGGFDWGVSQIYYTDSATSVWSTVHAFNWLDAYTTLVILGGRGYLW
jgi:hypothetical protein